jgi:hypothetical protein
MGSMSEELTFLHRFTLTAAQHAGFRPMADAFSVQLLHIEDDRFWLRLDNEHRETAVVTDMMTGTRKAVDIALALAAGMEVAGLSGCRLFHIRDVFPSDLSLFDREERLAQIRLVLGAYAKGRAMFVSAFTTRHDGLKTSVLVTLSR